MPSVLSEETFFRPELPQEWEEVLVDLRAFVELEEELRREGREAAPGEEERAELSRLHDHLVRLSGRLLEPRSLDDLDPRDRDRLFARAVLFLTQLAECVHTELPVLDTAGSRALPVFESDFVWSEENLGTLRDRLRERFGLSVRELEVLEEEVHFETEDARRKQAVARALRSVYGLEPGASDLDRRVHHLFDTLFPGVPLEPEEVRGILTGTLIFFCIPFRGEELNSERFSSLAEAEQAPIRDFLGRVGRFKQENFAHFPAFGILRGAELAPGLLEPLAEAVGLSPGEVAHELVRMVTILPLAEVDKYVVHDVWGHGWQASMLRFAEAYEEMARYAQAFDLETAAVSPRGRLLRFGDCFLRSGRKVRLDEAKLTDFFYGVLAERLPLAFTAVVAEILADVAEFKLLAEDWTPAEQFTSSSQLEPFPSKLDLTLRDVRFYYAQATKTFRLWARRRKRQQAHVDALVARGAGAEAATEAVQAAVDHWHRLAAGPLAPRLWWEVEGESLRTNVFSRAMLNFLGMHRALLESYLQLSELRPRQIPLKGYRDLLVLGTSVFFEDDRQRNLWRVDEYLSLHLVSLCQELDGPGAEPVGEGE